MRLKRESGTTGRFLCFNVSQVLLACHHSHTAHLHTHIGIYIYLSIYPSIYLSIHPSFHIYIYLCVCVHVSIYLYIYTSICIYIYLYLYLYRYLYLYPGGAARSLRVNPSAACGAMSLKLTEIHCASHLFWCISFMACHTHYPSREAELSSNRMKRHLVVPFHLQAPSAACGCATRHGDPCRYLLGPPPVASLTRISGAPERQARRLTRSDGRARERQAERLLPAPVCVCSARRGRHSL